MIKNRISTINEKIREAIKEIEKSEKVKITFGTSRYGDIDYKSTMTVTSVSNDKVNKKLVNSQNTTLSQRVGFSSNVIGKTFSQGNDKFEITDIATRRPKYPVIAKSLTNGRSYKFRVDTIKNLTLTV